MNNINIQENLIEQDNVVVENSSELVVDDFETGIPSSDNDNTGVKVPVTDIDLGEGVVDTSESSSDSSEVIGYSNVMEVDFSPKKKSLNAGTSDGWLRLYTDKKAA